MALHRALPLSIFRIILHLLSLAHQARFALVNQKKAARVHFSGLREYPLQPLPDTACQVALVDQAEGRAPRACPSCSGEFTPQPFLDTACQVALVRQEEGFTPRACLNPRQTRNI